MSEIQANKLSPASGTALQVGDSGDTITIPSGATITNSGTATGFGMSSANTPMFYVKRTTDQSISENTYTKAEWNSEVIDTDSAFASDKFTVPSGKAGKYFISTGITFADNQTQKGHYVLIRKNGSNVSEESPGSNASADNTERHWQTTNMILDLAVSDYVEIFVLCDTVNNSGTTINYSFFSGFKLT